MAQKYVKPSVEKPMLQNQGMNAVEALSTGTKKNNPFISPRWCLVNNLPNELLAHIFHIGMLMVEDGDDFEDEEDKYDDESSLLDWDSDDEGDGPSGKSNISIGNERAGDNLSEEERNAPFVVLVSHVCSKWRNCAIDSPLLWTKLLFEAGVSLEMQQTFLERSKEHPLVIHINATYIGDWKSYGDDEEAVLQNSALIRPPCLNQMQVSQILDIIIPTLHRWRAFCISSHFYESIHLTLKRLSECSSAPLLEIIDLTHADISGECAYLEFPRPALSTKFLLFKGNTPNLKSLVLWGVHIDWEASIPMLANLQRLKLCYHPDDVRPSFRTFSDMLTSLPDLEELSLVLSGPEDKKEVWGPSTITLPSVKSLELCFHDAAYIESLFPLVQFPNLVKLKLEYNAEDYDNLALLLATPPPGRTASILAGLEFLKIYSLPSNQTVRQAMLEQLVNLKSINLNCVSDEREFFDRLMEVKQGVGGQRVVFCPQLSAVKTMYVDGLWMKEFIEARQSGGAPISKVMMSERDYLGEKEEKWLRGHLEVLEFFEPNFHGEEDEISVRDFRQRRW